LEECGPCPIFAGFTLAFPLKKKKKHGKTLVRVAEECQLIRESSVLIKVKLHFQVFWDVTSCALVNI
jgi:hypothetical protein